VDDSASEIPPVPTHRRFRDASRPALSGREREVLTGLAGGESGDELAKRLVIAPETVRRHVANAREKLGARSRVHAVALALHRGEIEPHLDSPPVLREASQPAARNSAGL
jgi:DNA-binding CsgD family transcriptional regulator